MKLPDKPLRVVLDSWQDYADILEALRDEPCVWASGWAGNARFDGRYVIDLYVRLSSQCKEQQ